MELSSENRDGVNVIAIQGEIDGSTAPKLQDAILPLIVPQAHLLLDASQVAYMSSAGLRVMLMFYRQVKEANGLLVLVGVAPDIQDAMNATGFLKYFTLVSTVDEGLQFLGAQ